MALIPLLLVLALPTTQGVDEESRYDVYRQAAGYEGLKMHGGTTLMREGHASQDLTDEGFSSQFRSRPTSLMQEALGKHSFRERPVQMPHSPLWYKGHFPLSLRQALCKFNLPTSRRVRAVEEPSQEGTDLPPSLKDQQLQLAEEVLLQELNHVVVTKTPSVPSHAVPVVKKPTPNLTEVDSVLLADELIPVSSRPRVTTEGDLESSGFGDTSPQSQGAPVSTQTVSSGQVTLSTPVLPTEAVIPVSPVLGRTGTNSGIQSEESGNFLPKPSPTTTDFPTSSPTRYVPYWLNPTEADTTQKTVKKPEKTSTERPILSTTNETQVHSSNSLHFLPTVNLAHGTTTAQSIQRLSSTPTSESTSTVAPAASIDGRTGVSSINNSVAGGPLSSQKRPEDQSGSDSDLLPVLTKPSHTFYSALPSSSHSPVVQNEFQVNKAPGYSATSSLKKPSRNKGTVHSSSIGPQYALHTPGTNYQLSLICDSFYPFKCYVKRNITQQSGISVSNHDHVLAAGQYQVNENPTGANKEQQQNLGKIQETDYIQANGKEGRPVLNPYLPVQEQSFQGRPYYSAITYPGVFHYPLSAGYTGVNSGPIHFPDYRQESRPAGQGNPCLAYRLITCTHQQILGLKAVMRYVTNVFDVVLDGRRKREVWGDLVELPEGLGVGPVVSEHLLEAVETLDEESLLEVLAALREEYVAERPGAELAVEEVYHRLVTSLLAYKRGRERRSVKAAAAAVALELLAEGAEPPLGDSPAAPQPQRHHEEPDDLSFLELLNLASRHKTKSKS